MSSFLCLNCDSHFLCGPPPHPIWVIPLYECSLHSALALISLCRLPFLRNAILLSLASDFGPKLLSSHVDMLSSSSYTYFLPHQCTDETFTLLRHWLYVGLLSPPIPHTGLPTLCHVDILTLVSPHLPTMDCSHPAWMLSSPHLGPDTT